MHLIADLERGDVELETLRHRHRQRLDGDLADDLGQQASERDARGDADELDRDLRLDRPVEPDLVEVDVQQRRSPRIELIVLQDGVMGLLLALEDDVQDRVRPVASPERLAQLPLLDHKGAWAPRAVEHTGNETLATQPPRRPGAAVLAFAHLELDAFSSHPAGKCSRRPTALCSDRFGSRRRSEE